MPFNMNKGVLKVIILDMTFMMVSDLLSVVLETLGRVKSYNRKLPQ